MISYNSYNSYEEGREVGRDVATIYELIGQAEAESRDQKAKKAGFIVAHTGELYTRALGRNSVVYIEQIGSKWETWEEIYLPRKIHQIHYKLILATKDFENALLKVQNYFRYSERKR